MHKLRLSYLPRYLPFNYCRRSPWHRDFISQPYTPGKAGIYTTLAGFVEVGETFEDAVRREVFEETGIRIKNIRYFGSQPWAFPNSQMVGFLADYDSGEIQLQETELHDAQWFSSAAPLPELPPTGTIALKLINATLELCKAEQNK